MNKDASLVLREEGAKADSLAAGRVAARHRNEIPARGCQVHNE